MPIKPEPIIPGDAYKLIHQEQENKLVMEEPQFIHQESAQFARARINKKFNLISKYASRRDRTSNVLACIHPFRKHQ